MVLGVINPVLNFDYSTPFSYNIYNFNIIIIQKHYAIVGASVSDHSAEVFSTACPCVCVSPHGCIVIIAHAQNTASIVTLRFMNGQERASDTDGEIE